MKKRVLLITAMGALAYVTLQSDSNGPSSNYTGSRGAAAGCGATGGCHSTTISTDMHLGIRLDSAGVAVTKYTPGMTYKIVITDTNTETASSLPKFGFELSCVTGSGSSSATAGTYGPMPSGTHSRTAGVLFWEHATPLSPISGTGAAGTVYADSVNWTAPATGSGTVTMFLVMNAVNNNGSADAGDHWNTKNLAFAERSTTAVTAVANVAAVNLFPNPVTSNMNLALSNASGTYEVFVYNTLGQMIARQSLEAAGNTTATLNSANWAAGTYNVVVEKEGYRKTLQVVKQ